MTSIKINTIALILLTLIMISLGGITRLTESGLSIVSWKIITGTIPPLSKTEWNKEFQEYKRFPEYKILKQNMSLNEFKVIFYFEYFHRLLGRVIGILTILLVALTYIKNRKINEKVYSIFLLGLISIQGLVGWYMVKSGLIEVPRVSHFRLLLHFSLALLYLTMLLHFSYQLFKDKSMEVMLKRISGACTKKMKFIFAALLLLSLLLLVIQIAFGALLAGLDAGLASTSYPQMFGAIIPPNLMDYPGDVTAKLFSNPVFINFFHRHLGIITAGSILVTGLYTVFSPLRKSQVLFILSIGLIVFAVMQPIIGIMTLILQVPVKWAAIHQLIAVLLWANLFYLFLITKKIIRN